MFTNGSVPLVLIRHLSHEALDRPCSRRCSELIYDGIAARWSGWKAKPVLAQNRGRLQLRINEARAWILQRLAVVTRPGPAHTDFPWHSTRRVGEIGRAHV